VDDFTDDESMTMLIDIFARSVENSDFTPEQWVDVVQEANKGEVMPEKSKIAEEMTDEEKNRRRKKIDAVRTMAQSIENLRRKAREDMKSDDERTQLLALATLMMDKTAERVGNEDSAKNGHVGITSLRPGNVKVTGNTVKLDYVGKSGVKHEKEFTDEKIASGVKKLLKQNKGQKKLFTTKDGNPITGPKVNGYLKGYSVTAKDIRGYAANRLLVDTLKKTKKPSDEKERKKVFQEIVKTVAEKVGHGAQTLRIHYLLPDLESKYVKNGTIVDLKKASVGDRIARIASRIESSNRMAEGVHHK